jgi:hypothetical protein
MDTGEVIRLNLGAGSTPMEGYTNLDRKTGQEVYPLDYEDCTVEEIRASHVLEHFSHRRVADVLQNWVNALRPGGIIKIAVPDFKTISAAYLKGQPIPTQGYVMGGHVDDDDAHGALFDAETLVEMMLNCGLTDIRRWESEQEDCASLPISLNLQGMKPHGDAHAIERGALGVAMSVPRYMPTLNARCVFDTVSELGCMMKIGQGAYWHKVLTEQMQSIIDRPGCNYVLTVDYDSVFTTGDVLELYRLMEAVPALDAVAGVQSKRGNGGVLMTPLDSDTAYLESHACNLTLVNSAHFGLTLFRAETLRNMPHPWMHGQPDLDTGLWGVGDAIDHDMDFWRRFKSHGYRVALANKVRVGHVEELIAWTASDFRTIHQTAGEYSRDGKPVGAL